MSLYDPTVPNQSAFPSTRDTQTWGLTKREYFAAIALQGLLANPEVYQIGDSLEVAASDAISAASALLEALERDEV